MFNSFFSCSALFLFFTFSLVMKCNAADDYDPISGDYLLKDGEHVLRHKTISGDLIELSDGSQFNVVGSDSEYVDDWKAGDKLLIYPPFISLGGKVIFKIKNMKEDESIQAIYSKRAKKGHPLSKTLEWIDRNYGEIYIVDGSGNETRWQVYDGDIKKLQKWGYRIDPITHEKKKDTILIGTNESEITLISKWQSYRDHDMHILINFECLEIDSHVRARKIEEDVRQAR